MNSAQDYYDHDDGDGAFDDDGVAGTSNSFSSAQFARQIASKYQTHQAAPFVARTAMSGGSVPDMPLAHPPDSQQPKDAVDPAEAEPPSDSTGSSSGASDACAISDQVYDLMKKELQTSNSRK
jgi:hypothetical protein